MRKIFALFFILMSLISYSQGKNPFAGEQENSNHSSVESVAEPSSNTYSTDKFSPGKPSDGPVRGCVTADGEPDCNCNGIADDDDPDECAPNPGDPVPINDYIPGLVIIALGMIAYTEYRRKSLS